MQVSGTAMVHKLQTASKYDFVKVGNATAYLSLEVTKNTKVTVLQVAPHVAAACTAQRRFAASCVFVARPGSGCACTGTAAIATTSAYLAAQSCLTDQIWYL